jgi:GNAT superfamily N-acetyltransferase
MPTIRTTLRPGDIGSIVHLHGILYAREYGFDHTFEAYVAGPLAAFALNPSDRQRIWIAEQDDRIIGCIALVEVSSDVAQIRWYLVDPSARGLGLGSQLLEESIRFAREAGYARIILWTVSALSAAAHLYRSAGFRTTERKPGHIWGVDVVEEKYEMET